MKFSSLSKKNAHALAGKSNLLWVIGTPADFKNIRQLESICGEAGRRIGSAISALPDKLDADQDHFLPALIKGQADILYTTLPKELDCLSVLEKFRVSIKKALHTNHNTMAIVYLGKTKSEMMAHSAGVVLATQTSKMPTYGKRVAKEKPFHLEQVSIFTLGKAAQQLEAGYFEGLGTHLVRELGMMPANELNPEKYGKKISEICKENKIRVKFHSNSELKKMGAGAFTAVDQANPQSKGGVWELEYKPAKSKNKKPITLVGKGLCFDTGGYDVKSGNSMVTMKGDMQGSAVALAALVTASKMKLPLHLKAYLGVTENLISPTGYKADDIVTALNGMTIEVVDTDAEGRMVLADTLTLATKEKPMLCVDFATLTGAARRSLGKRYGAGFTNTEKLRSRIVSVGKETGERIWTFPMDSDYEKAIESPVADILQCPKDPGPDHIWAACFLSKFVNEGVPWVHIDLAASECEGGLGPTDTLFTGFGVRWALHFIRQSV